MPAIGELLKKAREFSWFALIFLLSACGGGGSRGSPDQLPVGTALRLEEINASLNSPVFLTAPPGDTTNRLFVVEKDGMIRILNRVTGVALPIPFLNLTGQIATSGEQGLLGMTFHPDFAQNGFFYVNVVTPARFTEIRRYRVSLTYPNQADVSSLTLVISVDQHLPNGTIFTNHKAGWLGFGTDRYLYAALGDGGSGGDPTDRAQDLDSLLGKMLRLDVDVDDFPVDANRNYGIPTDNPFGVGIAGADEIWALGLRNPWRPSFDRGTGDFYIADVGQGTREEVNVATLASGAGKGINYGWRLMEGSLCFNPATNCNTGLLTLPVIEYDHTEGCSITGGYVYRGGAVPALQGTYFYADYCMGFVRSFRFVNGVATELTDWPTLDPGVNVTSFGEDAAGELYIMTQQGGLFRIVPD